MAIPDRETRIDHSILEHVTDLLSVIPGFFLGPEHPKNSVIGTLIVANNPDVFWDRWWECPRCDGVELADNRHVFRRSFHSSANAATVQVTTLPMIAIGNTSIR